MNCDVFHSFYASMSICQIMAATHELTIPADKCAAPCFLNRLVAVPKRPRLQNPLLLLAQFKIKVKYQKP